MVRTKKISSQAQPKHVPQRTCVACREIRAKQELIRLVVSGDTIEVDIRGRKAGRGAYLCHTRDCWELGLKGGRLERTLRTSLSQENREQLIRFAAETLTGAS